MAKTQKINIKDGEISIVQHRGQDYISLTDMLKQKKGGVLISKWLSNKNTVEFLGVWEKLYNPNFNYTEFGIIMSEAGVNRFVLSVKEWIQRTNAIGIMAKPGRYGGSFAHRDIAFELGSWISPEFKLLLIREFLRLKEEENSRLKLSWDLQRTLAKVNYTIHTDAIKAKLIPTTLTKKQTVFVYATEADLLNMALFGTTAAKWRAENDKLKGNIRDHATLEQLVVLSNLESINSLLIHQGLDQQKRLEQLNQVAITQMTSLLKSKAMKGLKGS